MEEDVTSALRDISASLSDSVTRMVFAATYLTLGMTHYKMLEDGPTRTILLG
jgi:hypothetical protein